MYESHSQGSLTKGCRGFLGRKGGREIVEKGWEGAKRDGDNL